jgi:hypothetical protein
VGRRKDRKDRSRRGEPFDLDSRILWVCEEYRLRDCSQPAEGSLVAKYSLAKEERWTKYDPLEEHPDLFLKFARLREQGRSVDTALSWAHEYGLLGCFEAEPAVRKEPLEAFFEEMDRAAAVLALYEAALDRHGAAGDAAVGWLIRKEFPSVASLDWYLAWEDGMERGFWDGEGYAVSAAAFEVQRMVKRHAYPAFYVEPGTTETSRLKAGWGFENLLGAMYLQMYWLMTSGEDPTRCRYCGRIVSLGRTSPDARKIRSDKSFCDDACRQRYHYHNNIKPRRQGKRD